MSDRVGVALYYSLQAWIEDAGLTDLVRGSLRTWFEGDSIIVGAHSRSRGTVSFAISADLLDRVAQRVTDAQIADHVLNAKAQAFDLVQPHALEAVQKIARMTHKGKGVGSGPDTRRQVDELTKAKKSKKEIADLLGVSEGTVAAARRANRRASGV